MNAQTEEATPKQPAVPRGPSPENAARLQHIFDRTNAEPGVRSPVLAHELGISTLSCSQLADRLVRKGEIQVFKIAGGVRTYYPAGFDLTTIVTEAPAEEPTEE